ncbi:MAG TPA: ABC transporter permease [Pseudonocardiaceae bacterium]
MSVLPLDAGQAAGGSVKRRLRAALRKPAGVFGATWLLLLVVASITSPLWLPHEVDEQDLAAALAGPSGTHWLGTDELGRDMFSRIVAAAGEALIGSAITVIVAFGIGVPLALFAAEHGQQAERVVSRITEILLALPGMVILLAVIGVIGPRIYIVMAVLGVMISAAVYRVLLAVAQSVRKRLYVDAARVNGLGSLAVNVRHVLPAMLTTIAVQAAQLFGIGLLIEAGLAFIGFGPRPPVPSWGDMIQAASVHITDDPWLMVPTGAVLALTVMAANELADAISGGAPKPAPRLARMRRRAAVTGPAEPRDPTAVLEVRDLTVAVDGGPALVTGVSSPWRRDLCSAWSASPAAGRR